MFGGAGGGYGGQGGGFGGPGGRLPPCAPGYGMENRGRMSPPCAPGYAASIRTNMFSSCTARYNNNASHMSQPLSSGSAYPNSYGTLPYATSQNVPMMRSADGMNNYFANRYRNNNGNGTNGYPCYNNKDVSRGVCVSENTCAFRPDKKSRYVDSAEFNVSNQYSTYGNTRNSDFCRKPKISFCQVCSTCGTVKSVSQTSDYGREYFMKQDFYGTQNVNKSCYPPSTSRRQAR